MKFGVALILLMIPLNPVGLVIADCYMEHKLFSFICLLQLLTGII